MEPSLSRAYEELKHLYRLTGHLYISSVYRVPMRNWNNKLRIQNGKLEICLSRAYEELKPKAKTKTTKTKKKFIACLWGIETMITYWVWKGSPRVYRVPMRNWNECDPGNSRIQVFPVYRVPMRNWNKHIG